MKPRGKKKKISKHWNSWVWNSSGRELCKIGRVLQKGLKMKGGGGGHAFVLWHFMRTTSGEKGLRCLLPLAVPGQEVTGSQSISGSLGGCERVETGSEENYIPREKIQSAFYILGPCIWEDLTEMFSKLLTTTPF